MALFLAAAVGAVVWVSVVMWRAKKLPLGWKGNRLTVRTSNQVRVYEAEKNFPILHDRLQRRLCTVQKVNICIHTCMYDWIYEKKNLRRALSFEISKTDPLLGAGNVKLDKVRVPCPVGKSICRSDPQLETPQCMYVPSEVGSTPSEEGAAVFQYRMFNAFHNT